MGLPELRPITFEQYQAWFERWSSRLPDRSPYHHPAWLQAVARGVSFENVFIGLYAGGELSGAVPGFLTRRGPFRLYGSPLRGTMTSYLGPVSLEPPASPDERLELILACRRFVRRQWGAGYIRFTQRDLPPDGLPELDADWEQQRPGSYRLDLCRSEQAIWDGLKSDCRRNIRRAQREGIEVVPLADAGLFFQILEETFRRHGTASWHPERFFALVLENLIPQGLLWAWGARYNGEIVAAGLFLHDDREVHFISGASLPKYGSLPTSYLLHWNAIQAGVRCGLHVFNSDASKVPSIDQFKASFRPALEKRHTLIWAPGHVRLAQKAFTAGYEQVRKLKARLRG